MTDKTNELEKELGHDGYPLWQVFKETAERLGWPLEEFAPSGLDQYYQLVKAGYDHAAAELREQLNAANYLIGLVGKYYPLAEDAISFELMEYVRKYPEVGKAVFSCEYSEQNPVYCQQCGGHEHLCKKPPMAC